MNVLRALRRRLLAVCAILLVACTWTSPSNLTAGNFVPSIATPGPGGGDLFDIQGAALARVPAGISAMPGVDAGLGKDIIHAATVTAGPFNLRPGYRPMEGPCAFGSFRIGNLIDSGQIVFAEQRVQYHDGYVRSRSTSLQPPLAPQIPGGNLVKRNLANLHLKPTTLWWFKGAKVEVIDEQGRVLPASDFLCHVSIDTHPRVHHRLFPDATPSGNYRLATFTQGQTSLHLPAGCGVPFADSEPLTITFQALNRTYKARSIKERCTFYFIKDKDIHTPISALNWYVQFITLLLDRTASSNAAPKPLCSSMCCGGVGEDAPNNVIHNYYWNEKGQKLTGHWVVPPGLHVYRGPITAARFAEQGPIRYAWVHAHPFCQSVSLVEYACRGKQQDHETAGTQQKILFTARCATVTSPGIRLARIDHISAPQGIPLKKTGKYFLEAVYNNTSGINQDGMAITGLFFLDLKFKKPEWAVERPPSPLREVVVEAGPFDLGKRYLSMQGPYANCRFSLRCLDKHRYVNITACPIRTVQRGHALSMAGTAATGTVGGAGTHQLLPVGKNDLQERIGPPVQIDAGSQTWWSQWSKQLQLLSQYLQSINPTAVHTPEQSHRRPPKLYWYEGTDAEVLDENGQVMSGAEFLCHINIDVDRPRFRRLFPDATPSGTTRLCTITQGQTRIILPEGFGVPFASPDRFSLDLQAANRSTSRNRRIKLRCRLFFVADQDVKTSKPITALSWLTGYIKVKASKGSGDASKGSGVTSNPELHSCDECSSISEGQMASSCGRGSIFSSKGQTLIGHWAVPCGVHEYHSPVNLMMIGAGEPIHAVWLHVHPFCRSCSLVEYVGRQRKTVFTIHCRTTMSPGIVLTHIDYITSRRGINLDKNARYVMEAAYNNTSGSVQDSMATMGMFFLDRKFKKPAWACS